MISRAAVGRDIIAAKLVVSGTTTISSLRACALPTGSSTTRRFWQQLAVGARIAGGHRGQAMRAPGQPRWGQPRRGQLRCGRQRCDMTAAANRRRQARTLPRSATATGSEAASRCRLTSSYAVGAYYRPWCYLPALPSFHSRLWVGDRPPSLGDLLCSLVHSR